MTGNAFQAMLTNHDVTGTQRYDPVAQVMHRTTIRRRSDAGVPHETADQDRVPLHPPAGARALLERHGLRVQEQFGDWERGPLCAESATVITVCGPKAG